LIKFGLGAATAILSLQLVGCSADLGSGGGTPTFRSGFVYVRRDDRNVYLADDSAPSIPIQVTTGGGNRMPALSKDASKIVFVHGSGANAEIDTISVNAASGIAPTTLVTSDASHSDFRNPVFSPDGSYIVFAYLSSGSSLLGRVSVNGGAIQRIIGGPSRSYTSPSFFPGVTQLLAASGITAGNFDALEQVSLTGSVSMRTQLPPETTGLANRAQISPDGNQVALDVLSNGASRLYGYNLMDRSFHRLVFYPAAPSNETFPTWVGISQVGYSSDYGGNDSVYVVASSATDGSGVLKVPSAIEPFYAPY
jgi:Tol biopolymer transport system component